MTHLNMPRDRTATDPLKLGRSVLAVGLCLLGLITLAWVALSLARGHGLTHESGVLTGLAMDTAAGEFYRPLLGPGGYGGTRYGPLQILLQAAQIRVGINAVVAGHLVVLISAAVLAWGMVRLLARLGIATASAVAAPLLLLVSPATEHALIEIRPDVLPAALNVLGLVLVAGLTTGPQNRRQTAAGVAAAVCFAAAAAAKMTAGFGVVAACLYLLSLRRFRTAAMLAVLTGAATGVALAAANTASAGRMWENFRTCANVAGQPRLGLAGWFRILAEVWIQDDLPGTALTATAVCAWAVAGGAVKWSLPGIYLLVTVPMTLLMFFSPGLSTNHLIDVHVAAALLLACCLSQPGRFRTVLTGVVSGIVLLSAAAALRPYHFAPARFRRADAYRKSVALATGLAPSDLAGCGPIFSDNAAIPVAAGQRPFLLDDYMFPTVRDALPAVQTDLYRRIDDRYFAGIVLRYDPQAPNRRWVFGQTFAEKLEANYDLVGRTSVWDHLWIYRPKKR